MRNLSSQTRDWTRAPAVEAQSLNHWTARNPAPAPSPPAPTQHDFCVTASFLTEGSRLVYCFLQKVLSPWPPASQHVSPLCLSPMRLGGWGSCLLNCEKETFLLRCKWVPQLTPHQWLKDRLFLPFSRKWAASFWRMKCDDEWKKKNPRRFQRAWYYIYKAQKTYQVHPQRFCLGIIKGEGNGTPLQHSCLENPMDGGVWWAAVHGVAKSQTRLSDFTFTFHFHALEKEMATHSSVLAWRIPGTGEPCGLPSMGLHRVGHDWSDLAAAAGWIWLNKHFLHFALWPVTGHTL